MHHSSARSIVDWSYSGILVVVIGVAWLGNHAAQAKLIQDFDDPALTLNRDGSEPGPAVVAGGPDGHFLRLTNNTGSQGNTVGFDEDSSITGPQPFGTTLSFDFRMTDDQANDDAGGCCGQAADGFGIGMFLTSTYGTSGPGPANGTNGVSWERPAFPDALTIGFDIFDSGGGPAVDGNTVSLNVFGTEVATNTLPADTPLNNNVFNSADVVITPEGANARVSMNITWATFGVGSSQVPVFDNLLVEGLDLSTLGGFRVIAGSRTGGAFHAGDLDNIRVAAVPEPSTIGLILLGLFGVAALAPGRLSARRG